MRGDLAGLFAAVVVGAVLAAPSVAVAQIPAPLAEPSDPRAQFVPGNVTTCAGAGILPSIGETIIQVGASENDSASDPNVSGAVSPLTNGGEELNVTITGGANVVIDAVIVKGGNGHNLYTNPAVLPPALPPPQHYISPLVGVGNVPRISHWFVCYHETDPLPTGTLGVIKEVQLPEGIPSTPLPTSFSALVNCDDGNPAHENATINFNSGGGRSTSPDLVGIPIGTVCTIVEQTGNAPNVSYDPAGADSPGVTITAGAGVVVRVINDFTTVAVQRGTVQFVKVVVPGPPGVEPPPTFTVEIACDDGTLGVVTLPGAGGQGTPPISVRTLSACALIEDVSSLPDGWTLTYSLKGGPPSATAPVVQIRDSSTVRVTITNDASAVEPAEPTPTTTTLSTVVPSTTAAGTTTMSTAAPSPITTTTISSGGLLSTTGRSVRSTAIAAAILVATGTALQATRRQRRSSS